MTPVDAAIIRRKLAVIVENIRALEPIKGMSREDYVGDVYKRKATERLLQEMIEAALDINTHIIVQDGYAAPDDYYDSFIKAGERKIIPADLARRLAPSAGLQNRLVHEYDQIEHAMILGAVEMADDLYAQYVKEITDHLSKET